MTKAEVIADSISAQGKRLLTFKVRYAWFIHGEVMTHRVLSRNASSNRAIPLKRMLEEARSDDLRAEPVYWGAEQKGMEPGGELSAYSPKPLVASPRDKARAHWSNAAILASDTAEELGKLGLHKSLCNRLLMPFTHANVIITATEWDNFFGLRLAKDADPTMRALAEAMWAAMNESVPRELRPGNWHLPFIEKHSSMPMEIYEADAAEFNRYKRDGADVYELMLKVSVARCARVSYESHETGKRSTVAEDLGLYDRLLGGLSDPTKPLHASPAEHQATPDQWFEEEWEASNYGSGPIMTKLARWAKPELHGNLTGFVQYRKMLQGEGCAPLPNEYRK